MTWRELKEHIDKMTPEQMEMPVKTWGGGVSWQATVSDEERYWCADWDSSLPASCLAPVDFADPNVIKITDAGELCIYVEWQNSKL